MRYKNWACEIPDLDPRGFHPVAGKIRLYGGDGGGGGDGGAAEAASLGLDIGTPGTSTGPSQGNVVGSENQPGGWMTGSGTGLVSQGMNISLGLDKDTPAFGSYAGTNPNAVNQATLNAIAEAVDVPIEALIGLAGFDEYGNKDYSQISTSGLDYGTLGAAKEAGLGQLGLTNNQTINEALASKDVSNVMDKAAPALMGLVPGAGTMASVGKALVGLYEGYLTPGQALAQIGLGIAGIPSGLFDKSIVGPSLESVGIVTPSAEPSGTAGGDAGSAASGTTSSNTASGTTSGTTDTVAPPVSSASSANPLGLVALLGGVSSDDEEKEQANMADIRRGIAMTPYGMPYGG